MNNFKSILLILVSGIFSIVIATGWVNYGAAELAALIYVFIPLIVTLITIILFLVIPKKLVNRKTLLVIMVAFNIIAGILMRLDFYYRILGL